ncbi:hypothetical protein ABZ477_01345 [Microbacterium sp. NPDC019599]|uniref:hypothetical protein n=1 Tax=Microbacterium sp. NPDC019599 TaxID=3154690 RepID=UPI00340634BC
MAAKRRPVDVELAELRRRAYGPDADIAADPAAQLRLRDLEARELGIEQPARIEQPAPAEDPPSAPETSDVASTEHGGEAPIAPPTIAFWRGAGPWVIAIAAVVVAIVAGTALLATELSRPQAELTLSSRPLPTDVVVPGITTTTLQAWGIPPGALAYHGRVGTLDVWTMTDGADVGCVLLSVDGSFYKQSCGRRPLEPQIDVLTGPDLIPPGSIDPPVPPGSTVRFGLSDEDVRVFIARPSADDAP